jgi:hypothetical protein
VVLAAYPDAMAVRKPTWTTGTSDLILWIGHAGTKALEIGIEADA